MYEIAKRNIYCTQRLAACKSSTQESVSDETFHVAGAKESQPGVTSAEIAKALGHPSAAGALLSTLSEHSSTVSAAGSPNAEASSPGKCC